MEKVVLDGTEYEVIKNYKNGYDKEVLTEKYTDYYKDFDYIVGDWAYGKIRLKGFYNSDSKKCKEYNDIKILDSYLNENCAYDCAYFVAKKI